LEFLAANLFGALQIYLTTRNNIPFLAGYFQKTVPLMPIIEKISNETPV